MLTTQQTRALELASFGLTVIQIANSMGISVRTAEYHLSEARLRLEARNTTQAVASALRSNIIKSLLFVTCINSVSLDSTVEIRQPARTRTRITQSTRVARNMQIKTGRQKA